MANAAKKAGTDSLTALTRYLQRDEIGRQHLAGVKRYVGDLRQMQSTLKDTVARHETSLTVLRRQQSDHSAEVATLRKQLETAALEATRAKRELVRVSGQLEAEQQKCNELLFPADPPVRELVPRTKKPKHGRLQSFELADDGGRPDVFLTEDVRTYHHMFKLVRKRLLNAPQPCKIERLKDESVYMFCLEDIAGSLSGENAMAIGEFTFLSCLMNFPVGFVASHTYNNPDHYEKLPADFPRQFLWWIRKWMGTPAWQKKIAERTFGPDTVGTGCATLHKPGPMRPSVPK